MRICTLLLLSLTACGEGTKDDSGTESGENACDSYLSCASTVTPDGLGELIDTYGDDGSCWDQDAVACETACQSGLDQLRETYADPACWESSCGDFMAAWTAQCGALPDEGWCRAAYDDWRACAADAEEICDPDACMHLKPLPDGALYQPGEWHVEWTTLDYDECFEAEDPDAFLDLVSTVTLRGDGLEDFSLAAIYVVKFYPAQAAIDCVIDGADFECIPSSAETTGWRGTLTNPRQATLNSVVTASSCNFDLQGTMTPAH